MKSKLDFYFDYISPFAYFAWLKIPALCEEFELQLVCHPVVFGKLLDHWGHLGPAEIPPKRDWVFKYCARYAAMHGFDYNPPKFHPYNPLPSLRMSLPEVSGDDQQAVISTIFTQGWSEGIDLGDADALVAAIADQGIDSSSFIRKTQDQSVKESLIKETASAIAQGVFGVPSMRYQDEIFWGNDQFDQLRLCIEGKDPFDKEYYANINERERAIDRKRITAKNTD